MTRSNSKRPRSSRSSGRGNSKDTQPGGDRPDRAAQEKKTAAAEAGSGEAGDSSGKSEKGPSRDRARAGGSGRRGGGRPPVDVEDLCSKAWQIYVAEVSEEGVRMLDPAGGRDLAGMCFDLAAAFLEVQGKKAKG